MANFEDSLDKFAAGAVQQSKTDIQREINKVDNPNAPNVFLDSSWLSAIPTASANLVIDYTLQLKEAKRLNFPDTTEGAGADRWGKIFVGSRGGAEGSSGRLAVTGVAGNAIGLTAEYQSTNGITYSVDALATITAQSLLVDTLTRIGTIATCTTDDPHLLGSNVQVTISAAVPNEFNGTFDIQVTGNNSFTYTMVSVPASDATGTILADFTAASVEVSANVPVDPDAPFGAATDQTLDAPMTITVPIAGVDDTGNVDFGQLAGGADTEGDERYKGRYLDKIRNPVAHFNTVDIDQQIRAQVAGVTRTFIQKSGSVIGSLSVSSVNRFGNYAEAVTAAPHGLFTGALVTISGAIEGDYNVSDAAVLVTDSNTFAYIVPNTPSTPATGTITSTGVISLGRVQTYFMRDLDDDPIPTAPEVLDVKNSVLEINPANTPDSFVLVDAPTPLPTAFTFTELTPDLPTMRTAVEANLAQFFNESVDVGVNIDEDAYRSAIFNTVDIESGLSVTSFAISTPTGDIAVGVGEIPTLGAVTFV